MLFDRRPLLNNLNPSPSPQSTILKPMRHLHQPKHVQQYHQSEHRPPIPGPTPLELAPTSSQVKPYQPSPPERLSLQTANLRPQCENFHSCHAHSGTSSTPLNQVVQYTGECNSSPVRCTTLWTGVETKLNATPSSPTPARHGAAYPPPPPISFSNSLGASNSVPSDNLEPPRKQNHHLEPAPRRKENKRTSGS